MQPPQIFISPPGQPPQPMSPTKEDEMYMQPQASTSSPRITSPAIIIPGHEALSTTLTPEQLAELLPTLRIYAEPSNPSMVILPAVGISYIGLYKALRWREAELYGPHVEQESTLMEMMQIYQALIFLGNKPTSRAPWLLSKTIHDVISQGLSIEEDEEIWSLRHLPFTESFVGAMVVQLTKVGNWLANVTNQPGFERRLESDEVLQETIEHALDIVRWANSQDNLRRRVDQMRAKLAREERRNKKGKSRSSGRSAVQRFSSALDTVIEEGPGVISPLVY